MNDNLGIVVFYILILLGISIFLFGFLELDLIWFAISAGLILCAYLLKHEFKLPVIFWKKLD